MSKNLNKIVWFLYDENAKRVLLHRRDHNTKEGPDTWDCFGGGMENGELEYEAFLRELHEELRITIDKDKVNKLTINGFTVYYIPFDMKETFKIRLGEGAGFAWLSIEYALNSLVDINYEARQILESFKLTSAGKKFISNK